MVNGRFIVPAGRADLSNTAYTVRGKNVIKGYVISEDDQFSPDGNVVYTINAVNVVKATEAATLSGSTLTAGATTYTLNTPAGFASTSPPGVTYNTRSSTFTVSLQRLVVTYTVGRDDGHGQPASRELLHRARSPDRELTFTDTVSGVTFTFDDSGNNPITAGVPVHQRLLRRRDRRHHVLHRHDDNQVEAISYLPETTQYAFTAANGDHVPDPLQRRERRLPGDLRRERQCRHRDRRHRHLHRRHRRGRSHGHRQRRSRSTRTRSRSTATSTRSPARRAGADYSSCSVVGRRHHRPSRSSRPTRSRSPTRRSTYTLQLDGEQPPRDDYGELPGQAQPRSDQRQRQRLPDQLLHGRARARCSGRARPRSRSRTPASS